MSTSLPSPWLSILLPVYAVERWLPDCARSLLAQDLDGVELVFLDDASPDGAPALLAALAAEHPGKVRLLRHPERRGQSAARNALLAEARGEYLWFVDPDDVVEPGAVARLRRAVAAHAPDLVMCDYRLFVDGGGPPTPRDAHVASFRGPTGRPCSDRDALVGGLFRSGKLHAWTKVIRRGAWPARLRFPEVPSHQDLATFPRLALDLGRWIHVDEVWIGHRLRAGSVQAAPAREKLDCWMDVLAGFPAELAAAGLRPSQATERAIAEYWAWAWRKAEAQALALDVSDAAGLHRRYGARWRAACGWSAGRLERDYWLRGRVRRALRWRRWRRRAGL